MMPSASLSLSSIIKVVRAVNLPLFLSPARFFEGSLASPGPADSLPQPHHARDSMRRDEETNLLHLLVVLYTVH